MAEIKIISSNKIKAEGNSETKVKDLFNSDSPDISIAEVIRNSKDRNKECDKISCNIYYVLDGDGICLTDKKEFKISKGDLVIIPKNTKYKNIGNIRLLAISIPKFKMENQVYE